MTRMHRRLALHVDGRPVAPVTVAATVWSRARGLLGVREVRGALLLEPCGSVHTLGMSVPIDVAFCDADLAVLRVCTLSPWRPLASARGARAVLESAAGAMTGWGITAGRRLAVVDDDGAVLPDRRTRRHAARSG